MVQKVHCIDCGAEMQDVAEGMRCPWAREGRQRQVVVGGVRVTTCNSPYERSRELVLPQQTRTR